MGEMRAPPKVLIVDDDTDIREALEELLRESGYSPLTASNGQEAIAVLRNHSDVRAIVLDLMMPVMDGAAFREAQLRDPAIASIPFVLLTARLDAPSLAIGAVASFRKPVVPAHLLRVLSQFQ